MSLAMRPLPPTPTIHTTPPAREPRRPRPPDGSSTASSSSPPSSAAQSCVCPNCGSTVAVDSADAADADAAALLRQARQQIQDLQAQVARLDQKAAAAIDRWADYEDELTGLRRQLSAARNKPAPPDAAAAATTTTIATPPPSGSGSDPSPTRPSFLPVGAANRLSALLSPRTAKSTPNLKAAAVAAAAAAAAAATDASSSSLPTPPPSASNSSNSSNAGGSRNVSAGQSLAAAFSPSTGTLPPPQQSTKDLLQALTREQALRRAAEGRLQDTSREVEELSVSLFEQANEMVADERRARARLEARVATLEQRDTDKRRRLERLEQAMDRIARVRALLGEPAPAGQRLAASSRTGVAAA